MSEATTVTWPSAGVAPSRRVLRAATVQTVDSQVLAEADRAARDQRDDELAALIATARQRGHASGVADTLAAGEAAVLRAGKALEQLTATVTAQQARDVDATTEAVLTLALQISGWVLRRELSADGSALLGRLEDGLKALLPSPTTRISVAPADHALISEWSDGRGRVGTVVVADARLGSGEAVVVTDAGRAELTVAAALRTAAEALGLPVESHE